VHSYSLHTQGDHVSHGLYGIYSLYGKYGIYSLYGKYGIYGLYGKYGLYSLYGKYGIYGLYGKYGRHFTSLSTSTLQEDKVKRKYMRQMLSSDMTQICHLPFDIFDTNLPFDIFDTNLPLVQDPGHKMHAAHRRCQMSARRHFTHSEEKHDERRLANQLHIWHIWYILYIWYIWYI